MTDQEQLLFHVGELRGFYAADNRVGKLLDKLSADIRNGALRKTVLADARAVQDEVRPTATVHKMIDRIIAHLGEDKP